VKKLARLVSPAHPARCEEALIGYLDQLDDIRDEAFTKRSLVHAAKQNYWQNIPTVEQLRNKLTEYLEQVRPRALTLPTLEEPPRTAPPVRSAEEIAYVKQKAAKAKQHLQALSFTAFDRGLSKAPAIG
jgi:hypothetical protein